MNIKDYHKIDHALDQLNFKYKDIDITYLVRNHVISLIRTNINIGNPEIKLDKKILLRLLKSAMITLPNFFRKKSTWVFSNAERRKKFGAFYYDRVASVVSENNENNVLFIENPVIQDHKFPSKDIILSDAIFFIGAYLFGFFKFDKKKLQVDPKFAEFGKEYQINPNILPIIKRFVGQYHFMKFYLKYLSKPKQVFLVYPNGYYGYNLAFKERNIPVIELQHGIIYPLHPSYNTILFEKSNKFKPDYILTYGHRDKECLENLNYVKKNNSFVVGSYGLLKGKNETIIETYLKNILVSNKKNIALIATTNDIDELYDLSKRLTSITTEFNLLILPRHEIKHLQNLQNITVLDVHQTNIFEVYQGVDFLISKSSTSALEALYMNIPTFLLEGENEQSIFRQNYSFIKSFNYFKNEQELLGLIQSENYIKPTVDDVDQVYASGLFENYKEALNRFL